MTKELSPLEALEKIKDFIVELTYVKGIRHTECPNTELWVKRQFDLDIIETALKRLEELEKPAFILTKELTQEEMNSFLERLNTPSAITIDYENEKKLKALEIIKKGIVATPKYTTITWDNKKYIELTSYIEEKEFDLLKEVLK